MLRHAATIVAEIDSVFRDKFLLSRGRGEVLLRQNGEPTCV